MENEYLLNVNLQILSKVYDVLCECRKEYDELEDLLNPVFHLEECPYREKIEKLNIKFEDD